MNDLISESTFRETSAQSYQAVKEDNRSSMRSFPDHHFKLIVTSPPYNIGAPRFFARFQRRSSARPV